MSSPFMLTKLTVRNFKSFGDVTIELGNPVVFIGPNDSGKTTALQALALWGIGLRRWNEKRRGKSAPEKRPGVTINRRDLVAVPVPDAISLWHDLRVRNHSKTATGQRTENVRVDIVVEGVTDQEPWECGFEFDYANQESFYCRPLRLSQASDSERMPVPSVASDIRIAFLPPMSGLAASETRLDPGAIEVRLGEGRTAEVLRNLCHEVVRGESGVERWKEICGRMQSLFGVQLREPAYIPDRGEIEMTYLSPTGTNLDLSSSGRGMQQTLLLLAHLSVNSKSVLLLDEPDSHLEILRQRQIYGTLTEAASAQGSQIIAASHSEVILNEAADRDVVVAFVGRPHRIDDNRGSQVLKALREIGFEQYYQAEQTGWVLYLEGSTDLAILREFAEILGHPAAEALERPFVHYVGNNPGRAHGHFYGLQEAKPELRGYALFDRLDRVPVKKDGIQQHMWKRREIESYLCTKETLLAWAEGESGEGPLFAQTWVEAMETTIVEIEDALQKLGKGSPWSADTKVSDDFLDPLFESFYKRLNVSQLTRKSGYYRLARYVPREAIDPEVVTVLDAINELSAAGSERKGGS